MRIKAVRILDFTLVHENKLKAVLTAADMQELGLRYDDMDYNDAATRTALVSVLDLARGKVRFNPRGAKLFIEACPCEGGGCVFYVTCLREGRGGPGVVPVVFEFDGAGELTACAEKTQERYAHRILHSRLYRFGGRYRLVVYPLDYSDRLSIYFLSEYGKMVAEGELAAAFTAEHGEELIAQDAIAVLSEHFSGPGLPWRPGQGFCARMDDI